MRGCNRIQTSNPDSGNQIVDVGRVGGGKSQSKKVYLPQGICPTICAALDKGNTMPYIIEIVAMRGRYDENGNIHQQLEWNNDGVVNTITSVQKDNLVLEVEKCTERP